MLYKFVDLKSFLFIVEERRRQAEELRRLSSDFRSFKESYDVRKQQDTYRFAEIAEHEDFKINQANCNRVMITGDTYEYVLIMPICPL
jgi:hypothetical protein